MNRRELFKMLVVAPLLKLVPQPTRIDVFDAFEVPYKVGTYGAIERGTFTFWRNHVDHAAHDYPSFADSYFNLRSGHFYDQG